jgi:hypothetical protein
MKLKLPYSNVYHFIRAQPCPGIYILSLAAFVVQYHT